MPESKRRFLLLSRPDCHLCEEMRAILDQVMPKYQQSYEVASVDSRADWRQRFGESVPVLLLDDRPIAKIRLEPEKLERVLRRESRGPRPGGGQEDRQ